MHGWLTAKDELLMAERERLLNEQNQRRADKLHSQVFTLELLVGQGVGWHPKPGMNCAAALCTCKAQ